MPSTKQQNWHKKLFVNLLPTGRNYLSKAKRWITNNPLKSLTIFFALTSVTISIVRLMRNQPINSVGNLIFDEPDNLPLQANIHANVSGDFDEIAGFMNLPLFKCWLDSEFKNYLSEIQADIQKIEVEDSLKCPTIMFYEAHYDKIAVNTITNLLSFFVDGGYKTFIFEGPTGESIDELIKKNEKFVKHYYEEEAYEYEEEAYEYEEEAYAIMRDLPQSTREMMIRYTETYAAKNVLLKRIQALKLNYESMDLDQQTKNAMEEKGRLWLKKMRYGEPTWTDQQYNRRLLNETLETRDVYMAKRIRSSCTKHRTGQIVLVGAAHDNIEHKLSDIGYSNISSFYIINHSISNENNHNENVNIIDVYSNPNINADEAVISALYKKKSLA